MPMVEKFYSTVLPIDPTMRGGEKNFTRVQIYPLARALLFSIDLGRGSLAGETEAARSHFAHRLFRERAKFYGDPLGVKQVRVGANLAAESGQLDPVGEYSLGPY